MRILFDQGTPAPLRKHLPGHTVETAFERKWGELQNGDLLKAAENAGFEVLVTTDRNLRYQQNLAERRLAIVVLPTTNWRQILGHTRVVARTIDQLKPGAYVEVSFNAS